MKDVERTTIDAALTGSRELAVRALALHPLVPSVHDRARRSSTATASGCPRCRSASPHERRRRRRGQPPFLDLTFIGLERDARARARSASRGDLLRSPGGGAITAIGAARLGLRAALAVAARRRPRRRLHARARSADEGIALGDRAPGTRTADDGGHAVRRRARDGHLRARARARAPPSSPRFEPRAVVVALDQLDLAPAGARVYATLRRRRRARASPAHPPPRLGARPRAARQQPRGAAADRRGDAGGGGRAARRATSRSWSSRSAADGAHRRASDGELVRAPGVEMDGASTPPAPATCSPPPTSGPTCAGADLEARLRWAVPVRDHCR